MQAADHIAHEVGRWVRQEPHAACLIDEDACMTRLEVWDWAGRTAAVLGGMAATQDTAEGPMPCALFLPRSWAVPCGLLAARRAEMAFVPLDVHQPETRTALVMQRVRPAAVLCFRSDLARLDRVLDVAGLHHCAPVSVQPPHASLEEVCAVQLADARRLPAGTGHLVFTSGSTGRPKGVLLRDGPLLETARTQREWLAAGDAAENAPGVWALSPSFDASLSDIFCSWLGRSPLAVFRREQTSWRSLAAFVSRHGAGRADLAPSLMRILSPLQSGLEAVVFGGERCDPRTAETWGAAMLALQAYGPTEAAVCAMMARAGPGWHPGLLGRPLPHHRVLLSTGHGLYRILPLHSDATPRQADLFNAVRAVREDGMDADTGLEGEIWLAGEAVSPGYLDEPEAQRRRFGSLRDGKRVHYTGDLAHLRGGTLCWTGRIDRQLKVNGRMVCPEEVEMAAGALWHGPCACVQHDGQLVLALGDAAQHEECIEPGQVARYILQTLGSAFRVNAVRIGPWPISSSGKTDLCGVSARLEALSRGDRH